ncbi:MAG TPA: hypothetical protein VFH73_27145 [Polyangia bacterium]|jgi:hypothetical protein|nr:hypothetical protein [Polyangia bacterium]
METRANVIPILLAGWLLVLFGCASSPPDNGGAGAAGSIGMSGSGGTGGSGGPGVPSGVWRPAQLTTFESYPDPNSEECIRFNGCTWAGQFAAVSGKQTLEWVMSHNIVAVHANDFTSYRLKSLRLRKDAAQIDVVVYDKCSDADCNGCCTRNASPAGFLIDVEKFTLERFGVGDGGQVQWMCLDC